MADQPHTSGLSGGQNAGGGEPHGAKRATELTARTGSAADCEHPARRVYGWVARDEYGEPVLCAGCCECGEVLAGAEHQSPDLSPASNSP